MQRFKALFQRHSIDRVTRLWAMIQPHILHINKKCPTEIKKEVKENTKRLKNIKKRVGILKIIRMVCFVGLYFSIFSAIFGNVFVLQPALVFAAMISGLLGSTILIVIIVLIGRAVDIHITEAHMIANFIMAIAVKYNYIKLK